MRQGSQQTVHLSKYQIARRTAGRQEIRSAGVRFRLLSCLTVLVVVL